MNARIAFAISLMYGLRGVGHIIDEPVFYLA